MRRRTRAGLPVVLALALAVWGPWAHNGRRRRRSLSRRGSS